MHCTLLTASGLIRPSGRMTQKEDRHIRDQLAERFGEIDRTTAGIEPPDLWSAIAGRGSCRHFTDEPVEEALIRTLSALALCAPSKSDLQQRDIIIIQDQALRGELNTLLTTGPLAQGWIANAPHLLVFCGNNRRQRQIHEWRNRPFMDLPPAPNP